MKDTVHISFKISADDHIMLKTTCAQSRIAMQTFIYEATMKALKEANEEAVLESVKRGVQQAKEGKTIPYN